MYYPYSQVMRSDQSWRPDDPNRAIPWAEENLHSPGTYTIKIPASLADGEYLLRHEILGLHVAVRPTIPSLLRLRIYINFFPIQSQVNGAQVSLTRP